MKQYVFMNRGMHCVILGTNFTMQVLHNFFKLAMHIKTEHRIHVLVKIYQDDDGVCCKLLSIQAG